MIGNALYAFLLNAAYAAKANEIELANVGFRYAGSGHSRIGYIGPDNVAYKVGRFGPMANIEEFQMWNEWNSRGYPDWIYIPKMHLFDNGILACENMGIERYEIDDHKRRVMEKLGFWDLNVDNVREMPDGRIAIIDLGNTIPGYMDNSVNAQIA